MSDSLKDVEDLSLRFSVELGDFNKSNIDQLMDATTRQKELIDAIAKSRISSNSKASGATFSPGRRQRLFVIATDCYGANGDFAPSLQPVITTVMKAASSLSLGVGRIGLVLVTGSTLAETVEALKRSQVNVEELDALACRSGSEMYYPWMDLVSDADYESHIEYRWPGETLRSAAARLARAEGAAEDDIHECAGATSNRCYSYDVKPGSKVSTLIVMLCIQSHLVIPINNLKQ